MGRKLDDAFGEYLKHHDREGYIEFLREMIIWAENKGCLLVTGEMSVGGMTGLDMQFGGIETADGRNYYVAYTSTEEAEGGREYPVSLLIEVEQLLKVVVFDEGCDGLCINPYSEYPFFLPREFIETIWSEIGC